MAVLERLEYEAYSCHIYEPENPSISYLNKNSQKQVFFRCPIYSELI